MPRCRYDHVRAVHKQACSLSRAGHEVVLVTKNCGVNEYLGMRVVAAAGSSESLFRPVLNLPALYRQVRDLRGDICVLRNPDTIPLALLLRLFGHKVIYDTHEDFSKRPLIHPSLPRWTRGAAAWLITQLERLLARVTSGVIVTQSQQLEGLGGRAMLQPNAPLTAGPIVQPAIAASPTAGDAGLSFIYVGEITRYRGVFAMFDMIETVNRKLDARLELVGWVLSDQLREQMKQHPGWRFVNFHGAMSHADTLRQIRLSDVGVVVLKPVVDYPTTSVTKLYEYMQFGKPFIASDFAAWRIRAALGPAGLYVNPDSVNEISAAAIELATDPALRNRMGNAGKHYIETEFNWERTVKPFIDLVESQVTPRSN